MPQHGHVKRWGVSRQNAVSYTHLVSAFGKDGENAVALAMEDYKEEYGKAAHDLVLEYADIDYDAMPAYEGIGD